MLKFVNGEFIEMTQEEEHEHNMKIEESMINQGEQLFSENALRINELQRLLASSDFKFTDDYDKKNTPAWEQLKYDRQTWRDELRTLSNNR